MKNSNLKKLVLSTAIIGASSFALSTTAEQSGSSSNSNYDLRQSESQSVTAPSPTDRNITNPNVEGYSSTSAETTSTSSTVTVKSSNMDKATSNVDKANSSASEREQVTNRQEMMNDSQNSSDRSVSSVENSPSSVEGEMDVDEMVNFEPNSVTLTESAEMQLEKVVEQLDKGKPVALTVEVQGSMIDNDMTSESSTSAASATTMNQDSSAGFPADERGVAGARISPTERGEASISANSTLPSNNAEALESEQQDRAQLISRYRAENIRQYLERQGVTVVQWEMEGGVTGAASGATTDTGFATQSGGASTQHSEEIQQVRIVIVGDISPEGLSAL